jgi:Tannase-like family of unknown function (DUF6351)
VIGSDPSGLCRWLEERLHRAGPGEHSDPDVPIERERHRRHHAPIEDFVARARLQRANGRSDNEVMFVSSTPTAATGFQYQAVALDVINIWLDNIAADPGAPSADKVVRNKPSNGPFAGMAVDTCWKKDGSRVQEPATLDPTTVCNTEYPRFSSIKIAAGEPLVQDYLKCQLKPVVANDYLRTVFTAAELVRLNQIFPTGVCDYGKPSVNQVPLQGSYLRLPLS